MENIYPFKTRVSRQQREALMGQHGRLIWFTGFSGSGKSTLAVQLEAELNTRGFKTYLLDGDNIRTGLTKDLGFSDDDRVENIRRIGEVSRLFMDAGIIVLSAFISPFEADRQQVKDIVGIENHIEVFVNCPLNVCEDRDVKGLYKRARTGAVKNFTGITSPYEEPKNPDITIRTDQLSINDSLDLLLNFILPKISK